MKIKSTEAGTGIPSHQNDWERRSMGQLGRLGAFDLR
jgi:hypothetical protein